MSDSDGAPPQPITPFDIKNTDHRSRPQLPKPPIVSNRPLNAKTIRDLARSYSTDVMVGLKQIFDNPLVKTRERIVAGSIILDRAFGKPAQEFRISDSPPVEDNLKELSTKELEDLKMLKLKLRMANIQPPTDAEYIPPTNPNG